MSAPRYRPKRRLRSEILPLVLILAIPALLVLSFPSEAVGFVPAAPAPRETMTCSVIKLDASREVKLLASARASWQSDAASRRGVRADLLSCGAESGATRIASGILPALPARVGDAAEYIIDPVPAGVAAGEPSLLAAEPAPAETKAFSESDLLKLD